MNKKKEIYYFIRMNVTFLNYYGMGFICQCNIIPNCCEEVHIWQNESIQCLLEVFDEILNVLHTDGEADEAG